MDRRTYLSATTAGLAALAGCVAGSGSGGEGGDETPTDPSTGTATETETGSPTATPTGSPAGTTVVATRFEPREECSNQGSATITVEGTTVLVDGCITGSNGCKRPALGGVRYDERADELRIEVTTTQPSDAEACTQALTALPYHCEVDVEGRLPGTTVVIHNGVETGRTAARADTN